jgi:uncharacterized membrane protein
MQLAQKSRNRSTEPGTFMKTVVHAICKMDARHRTVIGGVAAALTFFSLRHQLQFATDAVAAWDTFAFVVLTLAWVVILKTPQVSLRSRAQAQDVGHFIIFFVVVVAASIALFAVGFLLGASKAAMPSHLVVHLILTLSTVVFSWAIVHTVFGLRYAHSFYGSGDDPKVHAGGLIFPGERPPDYFDFAYYAFVVGMTCQVSDVQISSRRMRRLTLLHSVLAFGFNTIILALLINTVSSLI